MSGQADVCRTGVGVVALVTLTQHAVDTGAVPAAVRLTLHADVHVVNGPLRSEVLQAERALVPAKPRGPAHTCTHTRNVSEE